MPVQLICHTKPYNNRNFQIDGTSRYFPSFTIGAVLSVIKVYVVTHKSMPEIVIKASVGVCWMSK